MPIRLCQKCGLKVLVDESQTASATFYCQRCTIALKNQQAQAAPAAPAESPPPASPIAPPPKPATVRVLCPYCKASFNGRVPQRPARGACPVCQKDLILLPTGEIRPAAGFDLAKWQQEQKRAPTRTSPAPAPPQPEGTQVLINKFSAPTARTPRSESEEPAIQGEFPQPEPEPIRVPADEDESSPAGGPSAELPSWLDEPSASSRAPKAEVPPPRVEEPEPAPAASREAPAPAPELRNPEPPAGDAAPQIRIAPELEVPPAPGPIEAPSPEPVLAEPPAPPPAPPKVTASRRTTGRRAAPAPAADRGAAPAPARGGAAGKAVAAYVLLTCPPALLAVLLWPGTSFGNGEWAEKLGTRFRKGFSTIRERLSPAQAPAPAPPPGPKPAPAAAEEKPRPTEEDRQRAQAEIIKLWDEVRFANQKIRQLSVGATAEQKTAIDEARRDLKVKEERLNARIALYKEIYGEEFDPRRQ